MSCVGQLRTGLEKPVTACWPSSGRFQRTWWSTSCCWFLEAFMLSRDFNGNCVGFVLRLGWRVYLRWLLANDDSTILGVPTCENPTGKGGIWGYTSNIVRYDSSMFDLWLDLELDWSEVEVLFERGSMDLAGHLVDCLESDLLVSQFESFGLWTDAGASYWEVVLFWVFIDVWGLT
jgi:hypothetical protein